MFDFFYSKQFLILLGTFIVFEISRFYYKYFTRPNPLPGPIPLPFVGNLFHVVYTLFKAGIYQFDFAEYTKLLAKEYGELSEVYQGSDRAILLSKAEHLETPFLPKTDTKYFHRVIVEGMKEIVGDGLFLNNDYQSWKRNRKFVTQSLMSPKFLRGFAITVQKFFERSESGWDLNEGDEMILNLSDWIRCFTTDVTISTSVGQKSYCLASTNLKKSEWTDDMKESREIFDGVELFLQSQLFFCFVPRFVRLYFPGFNYYQNLYMKNLTFLRSTILDKIEKRRKEIDQMPEREMVGDDILDILLTSNTPRDPHGWKNDDVPLTDIEIRDLVLDLTIAGSDTSANLFVAVFWYINAYPEVKARFLEEIKSILGEKTTNYQISHEDLGKFKYLDAIVKETHRMRPIVPINGRELAGSDTIAGYKWDSETKFFINSVYIQNQKDYWEEPEKFIPDRFLSEGNIVKNSYIPFGGGIRPCPGRLMAITEIKSLLILFFGRYNVDLVDKVNPLKQVYSVVNTFPNLMIKLSPKYKGKV